VIPKENRTFACVCVLGLFVCVLELCVCGQNTYLLCVCFFFRTRNNRRDDCVRLDCKNLAEVMGAEFVKNGQESKTISDFSRQAGYAYSAYSARGATNGRAIFTLYRCVKAVSGCFARDLGLRYHIANLMDPNKPPSPDLLDYFWNWSAGGSTEALTAKPLFTSRSFGKALDWYMDRLRKAPVSPDEDAPRPRESSSSYNKGDCEYVPGSPNKDRSKNPEHFASVNADCSAAVIVLLLPLDMTAAPDFTDVSAAGIGVMPSLVAQPAVNHRSPTPSHVADIMESLSESTDRHDDDPILQSDGLLRCVAMCKNDEVETVLVDGGTTTAQIKRAVSGLPVEAQDLNGVLGLHEEKWTHSTMTLDGVEKAVKELSAMLRRVRNPDANLGDENGGPEEDTPTYVEQLEDKKATEEGCDMERIERVLCALQQLLAEFMDPFGPANELDSWKRLYVHLAFESGMFASTGTGDSLEDRFNFHKLPDNFPCLFVRCRILTQCQTSLRMTCLDGLHRLLASAYHLMGVIMRRTRFDSDESKFGMTRAKGSEMRNIWSDDKTTVEGELKSVGKTQGVQLVMLQMKSNVNLTGDLQTEVLEMFRRQSNLYQTSVCSAMPRTIRDALQDVIARDIQLGGDCRRIGGL
jgi:hypothetical protein